jgi:hypothetical protein
VKSPSTVGAGGGDAGGQGVELGLRDHQFEVFRGDQVGDLGRVLDSVDDDGADHAVEGETDLVAVREAARLRAGLGQAALDEFGGVGDEVQLLLARAVLGLGAEVGRDPGRLGGAVGDDHHLAGAGEEVDPDDAEELALSLGDVGVAGPEDLVDGADAVGAEGEGRDGLNTAHRVDFLDAGEVEGREDVGVDLTVRLGRRAGAQLGHAGDLCGQGGHQRRGHERHLATRDVEAAAADRMVAFADGRAVRVLRGPAFGQGPAVEILDTLRGLGEGLPLGRVEAGGGLLDLGGGYPKLADVELRVVELRRVVEHGGVTAALHVGDDRGHGGADVLGGLAVTDEGAQAGLETLLAGPQDRHRLSAGGRRRRRRAPRGSRPPGCTPRS